MKIKQLWFVRNYLCNSPVTKLNQFSFDKIEWNMFNHNCLQKVGSFYYWILLLKLRVLRVLTENQADWKSQQEGKSQLLRKTANIQVGKQAGKKIQGNKCHFCWKKYTYLLRGETLLDGEILENESILIITIICQSVVWWKFDSLMILSLYLWISI